MDALDISLIEEYIHLSTKINKLRLAKTLTQKKFDNISFISSSLGYKDDGMTPVKAPKIEDTVIQFVDLEQMYERSIEILKFKQYYFKKFLNTLDRKQIAHVLNNRMDRILLVKMLNEIYQIEEACGHRFNLYVEPAIDVPIRNNEVLNIMKQVLEMNLSD